MNSFYKWQFKIHFAEILTDFLWSSSENITLIKNLQGDQILGMNWAHIKKWEIHFNVISRDQIEHVTDPKCLVITRWSGIKDLGKDYNPLACFYQGPMLPGEVNVCLLLVLLLLLLLLHVTTCITAHLYSYKPPLVQ